MDEKAVDRGGTIHSFFHIIQMSKEGCRQFLRIVLKKQEKISFLHEFRLSVTCVCSIINITYCTYPN